MELIKIQKLGPVLAPLPSEEKQQVSFQFEGATEDFVGWNDISEAEVGLVLYSDNEPVFKNPKDRSIEMRFNADLASEVHLNAVLVEKEPPTTLVQASEISETLMQSMLKTSEPYEGNTKEITPFPIARSHDAQESRSVSMTEKLINGRYSNTSDLNSFPKEPQELPASFGRSMPGVGTIAGLRTDIGAEDDASIKRVPKKPTHKTENIQPAFESKSEHKMLTSSNILTGAPTKEDAGLLKSTQTLVPHNKFDGQLPSRTSSKQPPFRENGDGAFPKLDATSTIPNTPRDVGYPVPINIVAPDKAIFAQTIPTLQVSDKLADFAGAFVTIHSQPKNSLQTSAKPNPVRVTVDLLKPTISGIEIGLFEPLLNGPSPGNSVAPTSFSTVDITPRFIQAITDAAVSLKDRPIELSFSPEELGRVRLTLQHNEGNMIVAISAERPETQDLLRRHIEILASQLREIGFQDVSFDFSDKRSSFANQAAAEFEEQVEQPLESKPDQPSLSQQARRIDSGRIDIRL